MLFRLPAGLQFQAPQHSNGLRVCSVPSCALLGGSQRLQLHPHLVRAMHCPLHSRRAPALPVAGRILARTPRNEARRVLCSRAAVAEKVAGYEWEHLQVPSVDFDEGVFSERVRIRSHEVGPNQQSNIVTVSNILQEAASNHIVSLRGRSEQFYAADPELAKLDLIFVLTRMQIRMDRYPRWGDIVRVETYFHFEGRASARRDWVLTDVATGAQLGCATSSWVMVNYVTRRLSKMPDAARQDYEQLMPDPPRACIDAAETRHKLPAPSSDACVRHTASPVHMDMNNHVNNTAYLTWLLDSMPPELQTDCVLAQYEVDYKAEVSAGEEMCVGSEEVAEVQAYKGLPEGAQQLVSSIRKMDAESPKEIVRARTTWVKQ